MVLVAFAVSLTVNASHLLGGMIAVAQTSQDSTSVGVFLIADTQGITPNTIYVEKWEMNSQGWYVQNGTIALDKYNTNSHHGFDVVNYGSDYLNLDSNKYRFIYKNCCWGMLSNSSNSFSSEFIISADYWHIPNNSTPFAESILNINAQKDTLNTVKPVWGNTNCLLSQFDNDSVNVTQSDLYSGYANGVFIPQVHTQLNMHVSNDSISWTPTMLGNFGSGFQIDEYRNNQLIGTQRIQWTFRVVASRMSIEELITSGNIEFKVYDWYGRYLGNTLENQKGFLILRYTNGKTEKIFCN